jgi:hypothetical protein
MSGRESQGYNFIASSFYFQIKENCLKMALIEPIHERKIWNEWNSRKICEGYWVYSHIGAYSFYQYSVLYFPVIKEE